MKRETIEKICFFLAIACLFAASIITITIAGFQLTPYRFLLPASYILFVLLTFGVRNLSFNRFDLLMLVWMLYGAFSFLWCVDKNSWTNSMFFLVSAYMLVRLLKIYIDNQEKVIKCCQFFCFGILIHNCIGWYEVFTHNYHWISDKYYVQLLRTMKKTPISVFHNPNDFATVLLAGFFILLIMYNYSTSKSLKILSVIIMISSIVLILFTESRANILGLVIGIIVYNLFYKNANNAIRITLFLIVLCLLWFLTPLDSFVINLINQFVDFRTAAQIQSDQSRYLLMVGAIYVFIHTHGLGAGAGNTPYYMVNKTPYGFTAGSIHNWWLEILSTYGIIIFLFYIFNFFALIKTLYKAIKKKDYYQKLYLAFFSYLIAFIIGCISVSSMMSLEPIWFIYGLIITLANIFTRQVDREDISVSMKND